MGKSLTDLISMDEIKDELGIGMTTSYTRRVTAVNAALRDVFNSTKLREAVNLSGRTIAMFYFGRFASSDLNSGGEKSKALELHPNNHMVVHCGIGNIVYEGLSPVSLKEGILVYGDGDCHLAEEICRYGGFGKHDTAQKIRSRIADLIVIGNLPQRIVEEIRRSSL